jgi:hypothetical protein
MCAEGFSCSDAAIGRSRPDLNAPSSGGEIEAKLVEWDLWLVSL